MRERARGERRRRRMRVQTQQRATFALTLTGLSCGQIKSINKRTSCTQNTHTQIQINTHTEAATQQLELQIQMLNALADTFALFTVRKLKAKAMQSKATLEWNIK